MLKDDSLKELDEPAIEKPIEKEYIKLSLKEIEEKTDKKIIATLKTIKDPEIDMDIWNLGLIYDINVKDKLEILMTFTSPTCPYGPIILNEVKEKLKELKYETNIELTFNPFWQASEEVKEMLGMA
tara:strand:- start:538 stop:915 length:378 start_codon:yes stop_codon:yes gene_type:complete